MFWKRCLTKVPNIEGNALEKITAVATMPVADELDVLEVAHAVDKRRAQPDAEGEQVDDRLEHARERRRLPEGAEVRDLPAHHPGDGRGLEAPRANLAHSASAPVSITNTSSSEAARRIASSGTTPFLAFSEPTIATAGPAGLTVRPSDSAAARTSARRSGGP